jgi:parallel beta-helix repeat protein
MFKRSLRHYLIGRLALTGIIVLLIPAAHALSCGASITVSTTLTADLGPCPGNGLAIGATNITLNLNGHKIIGTGSGAGIFVGGRGNVTILGPGEIASFATGIEGGLQQMQIMINGLNLQSNVVGMFFEEASNLTISGCNIDGGAAGQIGLNLSQLASSNVDHNTIERHSVTGVSATGTPVISQNAITLNGTGVQMIGAASATISGNTIGFNKTDGITVEASLGGTNTIEGNIITFNGGNGVTESFGFTNGVVQNNIVLANGADGIAVVSGANIHVERNVLVGNNTDLFWDGTGTNSCWSQNLFLTSSPHTLPACSL